MSSPAAPRRSRIGLRREVTLLVPASLLVLLALVVFTLLSYRGAVGQGVEERRQEALAAARAGAGELAAAGSPAPRLSDLRRYSAAEGAYLATPSGDLQASSGEDLPGALLDPFGDLPGGVGDGVVTGPDGATGGRVVAVVPASVGGQPHLLRVDFDAATLAAQRRGLGVLTLVVLVAGVGVVLLLILFLRQLLAPYDELVARARALSGGSPGGAAGGGTEGDDDDVELLVRTFERGMAALAAGGGGTAVTEGETEVTGQPGGGVADADLAALQRTLAASLESGLLLLDRQGGVVALNPAGADLLGVGEPEAGTSVADALGRHPALVALLSRAVERGQAVQRKELRLTLPESPGGGGGGGTEILLGLSVHPLRRQGPGGDGGEVAEVRGYLVLFADLTEARRRGEEARLEESLARLGELAAGVAHELRNSLATMRGYLTLMERSPDDPPAGYLAEVRREADQLQRVLEDFLAFARPGSARLEEISLVAVAERAAADPALEGGEVEVASSPGTPTMTGDAQMLERAVRNLLSNAREAHREAGAAGPVVVRVGPVEGRAGGVELCVEDRGDGIPPEIEERLFDPFVTARPGGVGLGLALSHRIVGLHGGSLRLEPRDGGGTRARMRFPAHRLAGGDRDPGEDGESWAG